MRKRRPVMGLAVAGVAVCAVLVLRFAVTSFAPVHPFDRRVDGNEVRIAVHGDSRSAVRVLSAELARGGAPEVITVELPDESNVLIYKRTFKTLSYWPGPSKMKGAVGGSGYTFAIVTDDMIHQMASQRGTFQDFLRILRQSSHDNIVTAGWGP